MLQKIFYITALTYITMACAENSAPKPIVDAGLVTSSQQTTQVKSAKTDEGKTLYITYCMACHQKDASGVPGMFPPLQKSDWVGGDKKKLISILLHGLEGEITVNDETYSQTMPKQDYLSDKQIAQVLTYVRQNFGNQGDSVKERDVKMLRKVK
jgi:mono/diheme cytochrome c family protein